MVRGVLENEFEGSTFDLMYLECGFEVVICEVGYKLTLFLILLDELVGTLKVVQKHHAGPDGCEGAQ